MKYEKKHIINSFNYLHTFSQAQPSSKPEDVIRRVANNVIDNTSYQFKNLKTGVKYASTKGLESMPGLRAESAYNKWYYPMGVLAVSMVN